MGSALTRLSLDDSKYNRKHNANNGKMSDNALRHPPLPENKVHPEAQDRKKELNEGSDLQKQNSQKRYRLSRDSAHLASERSIGFHLTTKRRTLRSLPRATSEKSPRSKLFGATSDEICSSNDDEAFAAITTALRNIVLSSVDMTKLPQLFSYLRKCTIRSRGEIICTQGSEVTSIYIIQSGSIKCFVDDKMVEEKESGGLLGSDGLLYGKPHVCTAKVSSNGVVLWELSQTAFSSLRSLASASSRLRLVDILRGVQLFKDLDTTIMNTMLAFLEINLLTGVGDSIELPKSKVLYVITGGQVRHGGGNEFPTGTFFMWQNISNPSAAAALRTKRPLLIATEIRTVVWSIPLNALSQIMKTSKEILEQKLVMLHNASSKTKKPAVAPSVADSFSSNKQDKTSTRAALSPSEPSESNSSFKLPSPCTFSSDQNSCIMPSNPRLEDFEFLDQVGDGAFSRVFVVRYRPSDGLYVLKQIDKKHLSHPKHNKQLNQEKQILMEVQNEPFVLHCYTAFEDQRAFYFVTEYIPGGELWTRIYESEMGYLSEFCARFYAANLLLALQGLHSRNIIYRDLKPENVMIDQCGYLKLVDLGFAKKLPHASITAGKDQRSKTLCGTHEYLAPELILEKGYGMGVDVWALGVLVYEMMLGCNPFDHPGGPNDIIKKILDLERKPITFPENFRKNFPSACHLMEGLLTFNPTKRMGCKNRGLKEIQAHAFFKGINWKKLQKREYETPFKPKLDACKAYQDQRESTCTNLFPTTPILLIPHKSKASNQESEELISQHEDPEHSDRNTSIEHDDSESQERLASQQEGPENSDKDTSIEHPSDRTHKTSPTKNFTPVTSINLVSIATSDHQQSATVLPRPVVRDSINFFNRLEGVSRKESMPENNQSARDADDDNEYPHYESITSVSSPCDGTSRENSPRGEIALSAIKKVSSKMLMKGSSSFGRPRAISKELEQEVSITLPNSFAGF